MIEPNLQVQLLTMCGSIVAFGLNWFLQSTILISAGLFAGWLLRARGSAFQSAVYRTTLLAVLLAPIASLSMDLLGLEGWSLKLPPTFAFQRTQELAIVPAVTVDRDSPPFSNAVTTGSPANTIGLQPQRTATTFEATNRDITPLASDGPAQPQPHTAAGSHARITPGDPPRSDQTSFQSAVADEPSLSIHRFGIAASGLSILWIVIALHRTNRLRLAIRQVNRLREQSVIASPEDIQICTHIATQLNTPTPMVLRAPFLTSPCLHGIRRPAVMLPEEVMIPLEEVYLHELAHLRRGDCFWLLVQQLVECILFFQPLLYWLNHRIDATAEEVCDDFVVQFGANRERYATNLVDLASHSTERLALAAVGMVRLRSLLGRRVGRIMDTSRELSTRVGRLSLLTVLCGAVLFISLGSLIGLSSSSLLVAQDPPQPNQTLKTQTDGSPEVKTAEATGTKVEQADDQATNQIAGRVLAHDGKPVSGAKLWWYRTGIYDIDPMTPQLVATSSADGSFSFSRPSAANSKAESGSWHFVEQIAILAPGHGFKVTSPAALREKAPASLLGALAASFGLADEATRLPAEGEPIQGRIVSIDGTPVANARVRIRYFVDRSAAKVDQSSQETSRSKHPELQAWTSQLLNVIEPVSLRFALPSTTTDEDGRFVIKSAPKDCLFQLLVDGEGIQSSDIVVHNQAGDKVVLEQDPLSVEAAKTVYANNFLFVIAPSKTVTGRVTDLDTGEPIPNAMVRAFTVHGERLMSTRERQHFATRTDAKGQFRLSGLPLGDGNSLAAFTTGDIPYFPVGRQVDTTKGDKEVVLNFTLKKTVWAKGRVIDGETGKPFTGEISYYWFRDQALEAAMPGLGNSNAEGLYYTNEKGEFRLPVLGIRGILAYRWEGDGFGGERVIDKYPRGLGAERIEGKDENMNAFPTMPYYLMTGNYNCLAEVQPLPGKDHVELDLKLQASKPIQLQLVTDDGSELPRGSYSFYGLNERWSWQESSTTEPIVEDLLPKQSRKVFAFHRQSGLAGGVVVDENSQQPVQIKLMKSGRVKGRLVDSSGEVIADGKLVVSYEALATAEPYAIWADHPKLSANPTQIPVSEEGQFELDGLIPGWKYTANVTASRKMQGMQMPMIIGQAFQDVEVQPGEARELGDVVVQSSDDKSKANSTSKPEQKTDAADKSSFTGTVYDANNKPLADARISIVGWNDNGPREPSLVTETTTDLDGTYALEVNASATKNLKVPTLVVRKPGYGINGLRLDLRSSAKLETVHLRPEAVLTARMVDIEGQPLAGLKIAPTNIVSASNSPIYDDYLLVNFDKSLTTVTDKDGRFSIHGVSADRGVVLHIDGNDQVAPQSVALNTGMPEQRPELDGTYRPIVRNIKPGDVKLGEEVILTLNPAQVFEGTLRFADTKQPVPNTKISIWSSQELNGSMISMEGKSDSDGRYKISVHPGTHFGIQAFAPSGSPYLNRTTPLDKSIAWKAGDRVRSLDFELPRGILVRGTISERDSGSPVADAYVQYVPESNNNKNDSDEILTGWQALQRSDKDGKFQIAVLPGPGRILVSTGKDHVYKALGNNMLASNREGGVRNYVQAFERIDPSENSDPIDLHLQVERGQRIRGQILSTDGSVARQVTVVSVLQISPYSLFWRGHSEPVMNGKFDLGPMAKGVEYKTHFLDAKNKLGATATLSAENTDANIQLQACGKATARFVDEAGKPLEGYRQANLMIIVTPGVSQYDVKAMIGGQLSADSDFAGNVDSLNHPIDQATDVDGRITYEALIPGAAYELRINGANRNQVKSFVVKPGETQDLGQFTVEQ